MVTQRIKALVFQESSDQQEEQQRFLAADVTASRTAGGILRGSWRSFCPERSSFSSGDHGEISMSTSDELLAEDAGLC